MTPAPLQELQEVAALLERLGVPHALIGGWAVMAWGPIRASEDIDFLIDVAPGSRKDLIKALGSRYEAHWEAPGEDDPVAGLIRARPKAKDRLPLDLLVARSQRDREALSRAKRVEVEGVAIPIVLPEDLIAMKLEAGGGQDYEDVRRLLEMLKGRLDTSRLQASCLERKVSDRLELLRKRQA